jgi:predicted kinase
MATLHLMVGLPCSGKTTLATQIEQERPALRLTPDEWIERLFGSYPDPAVLDAARDPMEALLWQTAEKVLRLGCDVILDFGFWALAERDDFRARAAALGARCEIHFLNVTEAELLKRLRERNAHLPTGCFRIDEEKFRTWASLFQPPDDTELRSGHAG